MRPDNWPESWKSKCLGCQGHVAVSAVPFTGEIACPHCGAINAFRDAQQPHAMREGIGLARMENNEGREGTIRRTA